MSILGSGSRNGLERVTWENGKPVRVYCSGPRNKMEGLT